MEYVPNTAILQHAAAFASTVRPRASETGVGKKADLEDKHDVFIGMVCKMYNAEDKEYVFIVMAEKMSNAEDKQFCIHCDGGARPYLSKSCFATDLCFSLDII